MPPVVAAVPHDESVDTILYQLPPISSIQAADSMAFVLQPNQSETLSRTIEYSYDALNRLTAADYDDDSYFHYSYDAVGNRLSETTGFGTTSYTYDDANRLTQAGAVSYTWDDNGNLLSDGVSTFTYDTANHLTAVSQGGVSYSYVYNGQGDRVQQSVGGQTTSYTPDLNAGLTQVLADGTTTYLYGAGRIGEDDGTDWLYYLPDGLGSVRQLADESGGIGYAQNFAPYGEQAEGYGEEASNYGFTGEWQDATGLVHLRARYYAPGAGVFTGRDKYGGDARIPQGLNRYSYGFANPITLTDPSGHYPLWCGPDVECYLYEVKDEKSKDTQTLIATSTTDDGATYSSGQANGDSVIPDSAEDTYFSIFSNEILNCSPMQTNTPQPESSELYTDTSNSGDSKSTPLTTWGHKMLLLFNELFKNPGWWNNMTPGNFSAETFASIMLSYEFQPLLGAFKNATQEFITGFLDDLTEAASRWFYEKCKVERREKCNNYGDNDIFNWIGGGMESAKDRYIDVFDEGWTLEEAFKQYERNADLANLVVYIGIQHPDEAWKIGADYACDRPYTWGNQSLNKDRPDNFGDYLYKVGGDDPWFLFTFQQGNEFRELETGCS